MLRPGRTLAGTTQSPVLILNNPILLYTIHESIGSYFTSECSMDNGNCEFAKSDFSYLHWNISDYPRIGRSCWEKMRIPDIPRNFGYSTRILRGGFSRWRAGLTVCGCARTCAVNSSHGRAVLRRRLPHVRLSARAPSSA